MLMREERRRCTIDNPNFEGTYFCCSTLIWTKLKKKKNEALFEYPIQFTSQSLLCGRVHSAASTNFCNSARQEGSSKIFEVYFLVDFTISTKSDRDETHEYKFYISTTFH